METKNSEIFDLIVCGAGPSGITAAIYAGRSKMNVLVLEKGLIGGVLHLTEKIDNYLGFPDGISGFELAAIFEQHMRRYVPNENIRTEEVLELNIDPDDSCFKIVRTSEKVYRTHSVIIGSGSTPRKLPLGDHDSWMGRGMSYCAICDGPFFNGKHVVVVGGGNAAIEEGIYLTRFATDVTVIHRRDELRATKILQLEAFEHTKMKFIWDSVVAKLIGESNIEEVEVKNLKTDTVSRIPANGVFVYIGSDPNTKYVNIESIERDDGGYIHTDDKMNVGVPGVFATGDVRSFGLRQISISSGNGAIAALMAERYISELKRDGLYCGSK